MSYFEKITEHNKNSLNKPVDADKVYYSELNEWYTHNAFRSFSVKFVIDQCIYYKIDGAEKEVRENNFMLACRNADVKAYFYSKIPVKSICVDICPETMKECFSVLTGKKEDFDNYLSSYFTYPEFYAHTLPVEQNAVGIKLQQLLDEIHSGHPALNREWFLDLAEKIVFQEYKNYIALQNINVVKPAVKKEILSRLEDGKEYISKNFLHIQNIREVATHCCMSEYHFYRRFREVYQTTPWQSITSHKMNFAKELLKKESVNVASIAAACNCPDVFSFSKAFKRYFAIPPGRLKNSL